MKLRIFFFSVLCLVIVSCDNYYSMEDFTSVEKIDAHFHVYTSESTAMEQAQKDNFKLLVLNTHTGTCEHVVETHQWLGKLKSDFTTEFDYSTTFCMNGWNEPGWTENTIAWLDQCIADGANTKYISI